MNQRIIELKTTLDALIEDAEFDAAGPEELPVLEEAVTNFKSGGTELLAQATEYMWAYYLSVAEEFEPDDRIEYGIPEIPSPDDVWGHVQFNNPPTIAVGDGEYEPGRSYISFEGEVGWEVEHGLQLVFEHGTKVCKVGPYDGHHTNAHAYADMSLLGVVFRD